MILRQYYLQSAFNQAHSTSFLKLKSFKAIDLLKVINNKMLILLDVVGLALWRKKPQFLVAYLDNVGMVSRSCMWFETC